MCTDLNKYESNELIKDLNLYTSKRVETVDNTSESEIICTDVNVFVIANVGTDVNI